VTPHCALCDTPHLKPGGYEVWRVTIERLQVTSGITGAVKAEPNMPAVELISCDPCSARYRGSIAVLKTKALAKKS
jgi:hypothetical protein